MLHGREQNKETEDGQRDMQRQVSEILSLLIWKKSYKIFSFGKTPIFQLQKTRPQPDFFATLYIPQLLGIPQENESV